jgi:hypothetical protein
MSLWPLRARGTPFGEHRKAMCVATCRKVPSLSAVDAAYIAGIVDGEGTITLSRKHAGDRRQLVISISSTERQILEFVRERVSAGKITGKKASRPHHAPGLTYAIWNRQALRLLEQIQPFLHSYKRSRAELVERHCIRLTPRNGKYSPAILAARQEFEAELLATRANRGVNVAR